MKMIYNHFRENAATVVADQTDDQNITFTIRKNDGTLLASIEIHGTRTLVNITGKWDVIK